MIFIGTSGFSFQDWKGTVYPKRLRQSEWLGYYEQELGFSALEVNMTYYRLPAPSVFASMSKRTSPGFQFVVKAHKGMTHNLQDPVTVFERFISCLEPLRYDGKLACVLMQFPYSFTPSRDHYLYLKRSSELLAPIPLIVEFRNSMWANEKTLTFFREHGIGYCAVDEPRLKGLMPFVPVCTSAIGYVRLHGRNRQWFHTAASERYNYYYSAEELWELYGPIQQMATATKKVFVFFNNCHAGHAAKNARELCRMLLSV